MTDIVLIFLHVVLIYTNEHNQKTVFLKFIHFLLRRSWKFTPKNIVPFNLQSPLYYKGKIENNNVDDHEVVSDTDLLFLRNTI